MLISELYNAIPLSGGYRPILPLGIPILSDRILILRSRLLMTNPIIISNRMIIVPAADAPITIELEDEEASNSVRYSLIHLLININYSKHFSGG